MSKYDPLYDYLKRLPADVRDKTLTFAALEEILGFSLPNSAHRYREWWSNPTSTDDMHVQARAWLAAGWKVETANQRDKWVRFRRN
ncbi:MAG: hypothetical protein K8R77_03390 [Anaerolineaceae bacterium]|nr:hypothetical protein [Anaerolineaceae bacterium]